VRLRVYVRWFVEVVQDFLFRLATGNPGSFEYRDRREIQRTIKALRKLQQDGIYLYGAVNRLRARGSPISIPLTVGGVTAGSVGVAASAAAQVTPWGLCGIVESAKDANNVAVLHTEGVWLLPSFVVVGAIAVGDPIYVITTTGVLTQTAAAGNALFARSLVALGAGAAQVTAKLCGSN
jgi:hypothetical protein